MNNKYTLLALFFLNIFFFSETAVAQCDNLTLSLSKTNSTCLSNGTITVTISGSDLPNINQSSVQFQVSGDKNIAFSPYANNTIENLPAGTYTISLRAFCYDYNDWFIASSSATTTITTSYKELSAAIGAIRPTLNCKNTGMIPIVIEDGTGSAPFTIEITQAPAGYTGQMVFTTNSRRLELNNLEAGQYKFRISDDCGYTINERVAVVGTMFQDFSTSMLYYYVYNPTTILPGTCNQASATHLSYNNLAQPNEYHYFQTNSADYYEVAFLVNDNGPKNWQTLTSNSRVNFSLQPYTIGTLYNNGWTVTPYVRVIGGGSGCEFKLNPLTLNNRDRSHYFNNTAVGCNSLNISFYPYNNQLGVFCYPYRWRVLNSSNVEVLGWQGPVSDLSEQNATNMPVGGKVEFEDNEGITWQIGLPQSLPVPYWSFAPGQYYYLGKTNGFFHSTFYLSFPSKFPTGTNIQFISGPTTPIHTNVTLTDSIENFSPFTTNYNIGTGASAYIEPGTYVFRILRPGCPQQDIVATLDGYKVITPTAYTTNEVCDGLEVIPTAGKIEHHSYNGVITPYDNLSYRIISSIPANLPFDQSALARKGGILKLPQAGTYVIAAYISYDGTGIHSFQDTITYTPTPFTLDKTVTSSYLCQGDVTGFIRVLGTGGSGNYSYELYDNNVLKATNTTGVFNYGTAGSTYTVKLYDTQCQVSYPQDVTLLDLGIAQIAYSSRPDNKFCLTDSVYLNCLTLGQTTYTWSGPGINSSNQNLQNPVLSAANLGVGTHTFTIKVTPENCGIEMQQTVTITVENCLGAVDDYKTIFMNTADTIDILANDTYPSNCVASVNPIITSGPTRGTYTMVNKKIYYTPNNNFVGLDSMKYSVTCGANTTATVYITIIPSQASANMITADSVTICSGDVTNLTASLATPGSVTNPVFKWYDAVTGGTELHTGATYTPSPNLTTNKTYYVSVSGTSHTESPRKAVKVTVTPRTTPDIIKITVN